MFRRLVPIAIVSTLVWLAPTFAQAKSTQQMINNACAQLGTFADTTVKLRDLGEPPSGSMQTIEKVRMQSQRPMQGDHPLLVLMRWTVLFIYDMSSMDAAWIRQRVETKCFQGFR